MPVGYIKEQGSSERNAFSHISSSELCEEPISLPNNPWDQPMPATAEKRWWLRHHKKYKEEGRFVTFLQNMLWIMLQAS